MRSRLAWVLVGLVACQKAGPNRDMTPPPEVVPEAKLPPAPPPTPAKTAAKVTVQMTAATLTDDCSPSPPAAKAIKTKARSPNASFAKADRACDESSMQLSITATAGSAASQIAVKKVEIFDDKGTLIGEVSASNPMTWSTDGNYKPWDQAIAPGTELSVTYGLSQPAWGAVADRRSRLYVVKAIVTVDGGDQTVQRDVRIAAPSSLPPGVKT